MTVSATSSGAASAADWQKQFQQVRQDFATLAQALQTGDLSTAQQAYAALQKDLPNSSGAASPSGAATPNSPLAKLGQALQSGDLPGAQQAFAAMQQARHGHHHHHATASAPEAAAAKDADNDGDDDGNGQPGSVLNATA